MDPLPVQAVPPGPPRTFRILSRAVPAAHGLDRKRTSWSDRYRPGRLRRAGLRPQTSRGTTPCSPPSTSPLGLGIRPP